MFNMFTKNTKEGTSVQVSYRISGTDKDNCVRGSNNSSRCNTNDDFALIFGEIDRVFAQVSDCQNIKVSIHLSGELEKGLSVNKCFNDITICRDFLSNFNLISGRSCCIQ